MEDEIQNKDVKQSKDKSAYYKEYYQKNKEKYSKNFKKWYSNPDNKQKMKIYMRNFMRKKLNVNENNFRVKDDVKNG